MRRELKVTIEGTDREDKLTVRVNIFTRKIDQVLEFLKKVFRSFEISIHIEKKKFFLSIFKIFLVFFNIFKYFFYFFSI